ncbi:MAG: hypothetical protein ABR981_05035, partial [Candidatus Micrarchaeaceae archaeon]
MLVTTYSIYNSTAEVIDERPTFLGSLTQLPDFGLSHFGNDFTHVGSSFMVINGINTNMGSGLYSPLTMNTFNNGKTVIIEEPNPITPDNSSFGDTYDNLSINLFPTISNTISYGNIIRLTTSVITNVSSNNLNYQWFTANRIFNLTPIKNSSGGNIISSNLTITVNSVTTFVLLITDNGLTPNPVAYNWTLIKVLPQLSVTNTMYLGQSNTIQATCSLRDTCEILINNAIQTTQITTANYVWKPTAIGTYHISAYDSNYNLYKNQTVNVIAPKVPQNVTSYLPITFNNNQSIGTGSNFQQIFYLNPSAYSNYLDPNLNNVVFFYGNGTIVNSWLEGGSWLNGQINKTSREADYWLKINPGIPSNSNYTIYMGFAP